MVRTKIVNPSETKAEKFRRLANARTTAAIAKIESVGKLGGTGYERTEDQSRKLHAALIAAADAMLANLLKTSGKSSAAVRPDII